MTEDSAIWSIVNGSDRVDWPHSDGQPINEFKLQAWQHWHSLPFSLMALVTQHILAGSVMFN